ncbi:CYTH domain-containing protein [Nocardiopsis sp. EMB25]|uniref:class IV adenylate cyclase n=1 Tax=Nocardiopsis TaxID=2013 RepID=UPI00034D6D1C|nr:MULTISPECIES: CYTH domain-containing protein [Nocardiopsis]MCY9783340.1 CYTH domain-containing protein [Nocardiopsis sp. EMB25]
MREIETKYRVADAGALLAALREAGVALGDPVLQDDQAYAPAGWEPGMPRVGRTFCRLRTQDGLHVFTTKTPTANPMEYTEHETAVADRGQMHAAVVRMGYAPSLRIVKDRRSGVLRDMLVCVDRVEGLGTFLELEVVVDDDRDGPAVQAELDGWARGLGVELEHTTDTYDILVRAAQST